MGHAEIELRQIPLKMLFAHLLVNAHRAALEDVEITLCGIGMYRPVPIVCKLF
jgi:hypothetical protein